MWFNVFGLSFVILLMIPNIIFAIIKKDGFTNKITNKYIISIEQISRIGCIIFMTFNIPYTWFGWWSDEAFAVYLIVNSILVIIYILLFIIFFNKSSKAKVLILSIIPSCIFIFSGLMSRSILLIISSFVFAFSHIYISYKNI